jgi:hypothetical protein
MLKGASVIGTGALVVAVVAIAVSGPAATAAAPDCKKANPHVPCTDKLKAKTVRKRSGFDGFSDFGNIKGETEAARRARRLGGK